MTDSIRCLTDIRVFKSVLQGRVINKSDSEVLAILFDNLSRCSENTFEEACRLAMEMTTETKALNRVTIRSKAKELCLSDTPARGCQTSFVGNGAEVRVANLFDDSGRRSFKTRGMWKTALENSPEHVNVGKTKTYTSYEDAATETLSKSYAIVAVAVFTALCASFPLSVLAKSKIGPQVVLTIQIVLLLAFVYFSVDGPFMQYEYLTDSGHKFTFYAFVVIAPSLAAVIAASFAIRFHEGKAGWGWPQIGMLLLSLVLASAPLVMTQFYGRCVSGCQYALTSKWAEGMSDNFDSVQFIDPVTKCLEIAFLWPLEENVCLMNDDGPSLEKACVCDPSRPFTNCNLNPLIRK